MSRVDRRTGEETAAQKLVLHGGWLSDCESADWFGVTRMSKTWMVFNHNEQYERTLIMYADGACAAEVARFHEAGIFIPLGPSEEVIAADAINFQLQSLHVTPRNQAAVDLLTERQYCGFGDWSVDQTKSVIGLPCFDPAIHSGELIKDVYRMTVIPETDVVLLSFGRESIWKGISPVPDQRPMAINDRHVFAKQY
jgi:hypothetical protein